MEPPKISFGFSKLTKKTNIIANQTPKEKKIDFIDCLEGQSIKIKDAVEEAKKPLIIPMKEGSKNLQDRITEVRNKSKATETQEGIDNRPDSELTLDELAARELIRESRNLEDKSDVSKIFAVPNVDKFVAEGKEESTLDDYESVPITDFGMAMLRGMGWSESKGIGKTQKVIESVQPELRPKGMGLGANKLVNPTKPEAPTDRNGKELTLVKGAYAKIIAGCHKLNYCEILGLDDESGRVIVRTALKGETLTINEFLLTPVTKEEYSKFSKIINNAKYQDYKGKSSDPFKEEADFEVRIKTEKENKIENENDNYSKLAEDEDYLRAKHMEKVSKKKQKKSKKHKRNKSRSRSKERSSKHKTKKDKGHRGRSNSSDSSDYHEKKNKSKDRKYEQSKSSSSRTEYDDNKTSHKKNKKSSRDRRRYSSSDSDSRNR